MQNDRPTGSVTSRIEYGSIEILELHVVRYDRVRLCRPTRVRVG